MKLEQKQLKNSKQIHFLAIIPIFIISVIISSCSKEQILTEVSPKANYELPAGFTELKSFSIKEDSPLDYKYILSKGTKYYVGTDAENATINVYQANEKGEKGLYASNLVNNKPKSSFEFDCEKTAIYHIEVLRGDEKENFVVSLAFQRNMNKVKKNYKTVNVIKLKKGKYDLELKKGNEYLLTVVDKNNKIIPKQKTLKYSLHYKGKQLASSHVNGRHYNEMSYKAKESGIYTLVIENDYAKNGEKILIQSLDINMIDLNEKE